VSSTDVQFLEGVVQERL